MKSHPPNLRESSSSPSVRTIIQIIFLVITVLIGLRHIMPGESARGGAFDAFCPFGGIETLLPFLTTGQTLKTTNLLNFSILIGVLGVSLLAGRAFCGWICPVGTLQDLLADLTRRLTGEKKHVRGKKSRSRFPIQLSPKLDPWLRSLKYLILAIIILASTWAVYPPLWEICPARALFSFQLSTPLLISVLVVFIITSMMNRLFWCKYLCPFGAVLAIFNKIAPLRLVINKSNCTTCGRCDAECPMDIQDVPENLRSAECIQCLECLETCAIQDTLELKLG
jgi:polyferredoxin